jgi:MFS transporter, Spinster family, sphingosine-1-phosphate transporter
LNDRSAQSQVSQKAHRALALLLGINLLNYIDRYVLAAVEDRIQLDFHSSDFQTGLLATAFLVSYMCFAPLFGAIAPRVGRWMLVGCGVFVWSLASGASGLATGIGMMLVTRAFVGIGEAAYGPTAPTIIADLYPIERRGRVLAWFYVAIPVGSALGYLLGGQVLKLGFTWHWAFFIVVPPGLLLGLVAMKMREPRARDGQQADGRSRFATYRQLLRIPSYVLDTAGMTAMTFATGGIAFWIPRYLVWRQVQAGNLDPADDALRKTVLSDANWTFGIIVVVSGLVATLSGGWIADKLRTKLPGSYFLVSAAGMFVAFPFFVLALVVPFPAAWPLIFICCLGLFFNTGPTNTILANVTHPSIRVAGYGLNIFIIHTLGDAISPPLIGLVNRIFGKHYDANVPVDELLTSNMNAGFLMVSGMILLSGVFWLWGARYLEQDTRRQVASEHQTFPG